MPTHGLKHVVAAARRVLAVRPSGLLADIDGTLSPIAPTPDAARVPDRIKRAVAILAERLDLVAVVTGRGVADARGLVQTEQIGYVGNHGLERWQAGQIEIHPLAEPYVSKIAATMRALAASVEVSGLLFEDKGASASIHYRLAPDTDLARSRLLGAIEQLPDAAGLRLVEGRMVLNLLPPVDIDKGTAVAELAAQHRLRGAVFLGDDLTDLDAIRALASLRAARGLAALSIAVRAPETPSEVIDAAGAVVDGVDEVGLLLETLAAATPSSESVGATTA